MDKKKNAAEAEAVVVAGPLSSQIELALTGLHMRILKAASLAALRELPARPRVVVADLPTIVRDPALTDFSEPGEPLPRLFVVAEAVDQADLPAVGRIVALGGVLVVAAAQVPQLVALSVAASGTQAPVTVPDPRDIASRAALLRELSHRVKNALAIVQAMAKQTARSTSTKQAFLAAFERRVASFATTHSILTDADWHEVDIRTVVDAQLLPYLQERRDSIELNGPPVPLLPPTATSVAMVFHELAANAQEFGALSVPAGRIRVAWRVQEDHDGPHLVIAWRETDGPLVASPTREGFGMRLLRSAGKVDIRYAEAGFECDVDFALSNDRASQPPR